ncbi:MAG: 23S rRNA (adenine(2503)-C(2))-methyltransferase RlmN [Elusimicrobiota bacterium]
MRRDIRNLLNDELKKRIIELGEPAYRADQIYSWLFKKGAAGFDEMKNLAKDLIQKLDKNFYISPIELEKHQVSNDGTEKFLFKLHDGEYIETVLIRSGSRNTICISSQVGCRYSCVFCASGRGGFTRDLSCSEIVAQLLYLIHKRKINVTNIVFMGMGEPLDNYKNVETAIKIINDSKGMDIAARRITVSTSGIVPGIEHLKSLGIQINLSISLHAANQELRKKIMPVAAKKYSLAKLLRACKHYVEFTGRLITLEYVLLKDLNNTDNDAAALAEIAGALRSKVNLLPYSPVNRINSLVPDEDNIARFAMLLRRRNVGVTVRESKGKDINAACGQLAGRFKR